MGMARPPSLATTFGQRASSPMAPLPLDEDLTPPPLVGADPERTTQVIEHDGGRGKGPGQAGQLGNLRVVEPGIEREATPGQLGEALAEASLGKECGWRIGV